ncbi:MAG: NFACT RNA binding domain-containing protein, partial [Candidatus Limivicinus sp.]|nr:NFACT RNA binding domain-containing protein [Candidatus Limivicinus sp.]
MPLDAIYLSALTTELKDKLVGGRIDKVQQPERDMLLLSLRAKGENLRLLLAAGTGNARVHLTESSFENPAEPPMFCMLLRKHLVGAHISAVYQPDYERLLIIELEGRDEMGFASQKKLVAEMIGRSANVILVDGEGRIVDCMRRMDFGGDAQRRMLPGMIYRLPPKQEKPPLLETDSAQRKTMIAGSDRQQSLDKWLLNSFAGLSPLVCRELAHRCGGSYDTLPELLDAFADSVQAGDLRPTILYEEGKPRDFSFMPISQYGPSVSCREEESFSKLLDSFYSQRDQAEQQRRRSHQLFKTVRTIRDRIQRKLASQTEELRRTEDRDEVRKTAELVTANIYRIKKGDRTLECVDYYDPECPVIRIALDPLKTPQQNAAALFKEYNKLKAARAHLTGLIEEGERQLDYLNSVLELLSLSETEKDISDIRRELIATGYLRKQGGSKADRSKGQAPWRFVTDDGFEVLAGRSNVQNDELTTKTGRRTDYWFHTQHLHGSHVILRCNGLEPTELAVAQAAVIAAYYSQGREGGKVPVDFTMLRFVRKPSGALPGKVIYTDYKTIMTGADEALVKRL